MAKKKILVADDEKRIVELISDFLENAGYTPVAAFDGSEAVNLIRESGDISLAVIDIMMPEKDGWEAVKEIRETSDIPIIMLSARSEEFDMLNSFDCGADEYVTKPFSPAVLIKRIEALLGRAEKKPSADIKSEGLFIDKEGYSAFLDGKELSLTVKEFELLLHLSENKGKVLSRDFLLDTIWGFDYVGDTRTVDSHMARLRLKLGEYGSTHLKTVYGFGYKMEV